MRFLVAATLFLCAICGGDASAREQILSFLADIIVEKDGALLVTETITVNAEGVDIRRGIFREIPMRALDDWGLWDNNGFELISVEHNGGASPYHTEWLEGFVRIYVGASDVSSKQ
jgi:hypothetical protein